MDIHTERDRDELTEAPPSIAELTEKVITALEEDLRQEQAALVFYRRERPSQMEPLAAV